MTYTGVDDLVAQGIRLVREFGRMETSKTAVLKELARVVVQLRQEFHTEDGRTDWAGRSHPYREAIAKIYAEAGLPPDSLDGMQASLRYHIGNVLRDVAPPDELADLGLKPKTPRDRVQDTRDRLAALARAGAAQVEPTGNVRADVRRMVVGAEVVLSRVDDEALEELDEEGRAAVVKSLEAVIARASTLLGELDSPAARRPGRRKLRAVPDTHAAG